MPRCGPVRFKACLTCHTRKVKCDEKRPSCRRCRKSGFICEGYLPAIDFVDETQTFRQPDDLPTTVCNKRKITFERWQQTNQSLKSLNLSCFEEEVSIAYLLKNLIIIPGASSIELAPWVWPGFLAIKSQQSLSYECLCAFSRMFFARKNNAQSTMFRGLKAYGSALKKLNIQLGSPQTKSSDDALISSIILSLYEYMTASSATGWIAHCLGFGNLIKLRGPAAYWSEQSRYLTAYNRPGIVIAALATGQSTFLSSPEWKSTLWLNKGEGQDIVHKLFDIYVDLPGFKQDGQMLSRCAEPNTLRDFFTRGLSIIAQLKAWRGEWDLLPESEISMVTSTLEHESDSSPFPVSFKFSTFRAVETILLYNAAILQTIEVINTTYTAIEFHLPDDTFMQPPMHQTLASMSKEAASEICQSLEFQMMDDFGSMGQLLVLFPIRMAWKAFGRGSSSEGKWLEHLLCRLSASGNWQCAAYALTFQGAADNTSSKPA